MLRRIRAGWWAVRAASGPRSAARPRYPTSYRVSPPPAPITGEWLQPPELASPMSRVDTVEFAPPMVFDVALFEALNAEYASNPLVTDPPKYDQASIAERSRRRVSGIHDQLDLRGKTVLEIGCGSGYEVWNLAGQLACDAWGIDITPRKAWPGLVGDRVHLVAGDIASGGGLPSDTFERVLSFTVWEHITRPLEAIVELARVMKPGGLAWIRANLYRGPAASHRYRDISFPFPHLLFSDAVIDEAMRRAGRARGGSAWVNRLTWEQYEAAFLEAGLAIRALNFTLHPLDEAFYERFEDVLGRYPKADLERDFFQVVLEKPAGGR